MIELEDKPEPAVGRLRGASLPGLLGAVWGLIGFALLLIHAITRLTPIALETFSYPLRWYHWLALVATVVLMAYYEGYRGFQKGFSPRTAARAKHLSGHPHFLHVLLSPLYCTAFFHTSKKRQRANILLTVGIIILIFLVGLLDQPWRGIIDGGVVVGLSWGLVSLLIFSVLAFVSDDFRFPPDLPPDN